MPKPARRHLIAAAVVVAGIATIVPVSLESAGASTAACGTWCTSPYNQAAGSGEVLTVSGNSVVMATASTTSSTQDWTPEYEGDVTDAAGAGVAAQKLTLLYGDSSVYEFQYAPNGVPSDTCLSDGSSDADLTVAVVYAAARKDPKSFYVVIDQAESGPTIGARAQTLVTLLPRDQPAAP